MKPKIYPWETTETIHAYSHIRKTSNQNVAVICGPFTRNGKPFWETKVDLTHYRINTKTKSKIERFLSSSLEEAKEKVDDIIAPYFQFIDEKVMVML